MATGGRLEKTPGVEGTLLELFPDSHDTTDPEVNRPSGTTKPNDLLCVGVRGDNALPRRGKHPNKKWNLRDKLPNSSNRRRHKAFDELEEDEKNERFAQFVCLQLPELRDIIGSHENDPDELLSKISQTGFGFLECLNDKSLSAEEVVAVLKILSIVSRSHHVSSLRQLLLTAQTEFLETVDSCLNMIVMKMESHACLWTNVERLSEFCKLAIGVITHLMFVNADALGKYKRIIGTIQAVQDEFVFRPDGQFENELKTLELSFNDIKVNYHRTIEKKEEPKNDFRSLDVFPSIKELHGNETLFLRRNVTEGKYDNLQTYLDIHFRLLREDYVRQLRTGIIEHRKQSSGASERRRIREIRLYQDVQLAYPVVKRTGVNHVLEFKTQRKLRLSSKCLLTGSLVCLSLDNFSTIFFATVTDRNHIDLGEVEVHLEKEAVSNMERNCTYTMAEATAFFACYRHVLRGLQETNDDMPFQKYILYNDFHISPPKYISTKRSVYNFTALSTQAISVKRRTSTSSSDDDLIIDETEMGQQLTGSVLDTDCWPQEDDVELDSTQYDAVKSAITHELAIIQGPPGTGKTYIGLKIAELLYDNETSVDADGPILIICFTNHALDQFMEGIVSFCPDDVIRLGGRCKADSLRQYMYNNKDPAEITNEEILKTREEDFCNMKACRESICESSQLLKESYEEILPVHYLTPFMTNEQLQFFDKNGGLTDNAFLFRWLGVEMDVPDPTQCSCPLGKTHVQESWRQCIVEEAVERKPFIGGNMNLWMLSPIKRMELYKFWVQEVACGIVDYISSLSRISGRKNLEEIRKFENMLLELNTKVVRAVFLLSNVTNVQTWHEIFSLRSDNMSIDEALKKWLLVDYSRDSVATAEKTLEMIRKNNVEGKDENRNNDNDDRSYDFSSKWKTSRKAYGNCELCLRNGMKRKRHLLGYIQQIACKLHDQIAEVSMGNSSFTERYALFNTWVVKFREDLRCKMKTQEVEVNDASARLQKFDIHTKAETLKQAKFIGMTTTCAAMHREVLQQVSPRIILVEEAAEVLEAHIISSINAECQHLILIGDHKQLRPSTEIFELSKRYKLDVSLFERLVTNNMPCITLSEQHRMRPEISKLLRHPALYPCLKDHDHVTTYEDVKGITKNVIFLNHQFIEDINEETLSYTNKQEAQFITAFTEYILLQGYEEDDITILSPYVGQVFVIRNLLQPTYCRINITTVDNYQGEENNIILLSLVRSKACTENLKTGRNPIGFVGIENRICVSLSRAKIGLFAFGNFDHLRSNSHMWNYMVQQMEKDQSFLTAMTLQCQNHPDTFTNVSRSEDFELVSNGGCNVLCEHVLPCGHQCQLKCHMFDMSHDDTKCSLPCTRACERGHRCQETCSEKCKCQERVEKILPRCNHSITVPCFDIESNYPCTNLCNANLDCGHICQKQCSVCHQTCKIVRNCQKLIEITLPCDHVVKIKCSDDRTAVTCRHQVINTLPCGHSQSMECHVNEIEFKCKERVVKDLQCGHSLEMDCCSDIAKAKCEQIVPKTLPCSHVVKIQCWNDNAICSIRCERTLICGHTCTGYCKDCYQGRIHKGCGGACGERLDCGHFCSFPCSIVCPPCSQQCSKTCSHTTKCKLRCLQPCEDCHKKCKHKCTHKTCPLLCYELCPDVRCDERCTKKLNCDHTCYSLCGEVCVCLRCAKPRERRHVQYKKANRYLQLPDCKCIVEVRQLDKYMREDEKALFKSCPYMDCGKAIQTDIKRYSNILKKCKLKLHESNQRKLSGKHKLNRKYVKLMNRLKEKLSKPASVQLSEEALDLKSAFDVEVLKVKLDLIAEVFPVGKQVGYFDTFPTAIFSLDTLVKLILEKKRKLTLQFKRDVKHEVDRTRTFMKLSTMRSVLDNHDTESNDPSAKANEASELLTQSCKLTKQDKRRISRLLRTIRAAVDGIESPCDFCGKDFDGEPLCDVSELLNKCTEHLKITKGELHCEMPVQLDEKEFKWGEACLVACNETALRTSSGVEFSFDNIVSEQTDLGSDGSKTEDRVNKHILPSELKFLHKSELLEIGTFGPYGNAKFPNQKDEFDRQKQFVDSCLGTSEYKKRPVFPGVERALSGTRTIRHRGTSQMRDRGTFRGEFGRGRGAFNGLPEIHTPDGLPLEATYRGVGRSVPVLRPMRLRDNSQMRDRMLYRFGRY